MSMKDINTISKERADRAKLAQYKEIIETVSKVEYKKFSTLGLIELSEVIALANYTVYYLIQNSKSAEIFNTAYLTKAIKWALRNEMRRRYRLPVSLYILSTAKNETLPDGDIKVDLGNDETSILKLKTFRSINGDEN